MRLIGIAGRRGSGKSTTAGILKEMGWCVLSLSDPMKRFLHEVMFVPEEQLWGKSEKRALVRSPLQHLGTEWGRKYFNNGWIRYCLRQIEELERDKGEVEYSHKYGIISAPGCGTEYTGYVIDDVRFYDEAQAIVSSGGELWKCKRDGADSTDKHESETGVAMWTDNMFDRIVDNNQPIEELWKQLV